MCVRIDRLSLVLKKFQYRLLFLSSFTSITIIGGSMPSVCCEMLSFLNSKKYLLFDLIDVLLRMDTYSSELDMQRLSISLLDVKI